jgi:hypothetical protein
MLARLGRNEGVRKMVTAEREAVAGSPDLESLTTSHIEREDLDRSAGIEAVSAQGLGCSKDLETHKLAVALHFGVTISFANTPRSERRQPYPRALKKKPWSLGRIVDLTSEYARRKEDARFEEVFAELDAKARTHNQIDEESD